MTETCTCGARLPEDARFCHKCGKDQREQPAMVEEDQPTVPFQAFPVDPTLNLPAGAQIITPIPSGPVPISLRNSTAVRAALPAGISAFLFFVWVSQIGPLAPVAPIALLAGGAFAVYLYRRRTGQRLSILNGARLGWLAGLFPFLVVLLLVTLTVALNPGAFETLWDEFVKQGKLTAEQAQMVRGPAGIISMVVTTFLTSTIPAALGGAVGAKLFNRPSGV